jgi:hypothetical protein
MKPAATLTAFGIGLAAVFGAAYAVGGAVPPIGDPAPASAPSVTSTSTSTSTPDTSNSHFEQQHPIDNHSTR